MAKATSGPSGTPLIRTYRTQTAALTRGYAVKQGTADDQAVVAGAAERVLGIVAESTAAVDDPVGVVMSGQCIAIAGGAVAAGDIVKTDANGKLVAGNAADVETAGKALSTAAADGDEFVIQVMPNQKRS